MVERRTAPPPRPLSDDPRITPKALEIFAEMVELEDSCTCEPPTRCEACERWYELNFGDLHTAMKLTSWDWPSCLIPGVDRVGPNDRAGSEAIGRYHTLKAALDKSRAPA